MTIYVPQWRNCQHFSQLHQNIQEHKGVCTFNLNVEIKKSTMDISIVNDHMNYDQNTDITVRNLSCPPQTWQWLNPWFTGLWYMLLFARGRADYISSAHGSREGCNWLFSIYPKMYALDAGLCKFWVPKLKNIGFGAVLLFWQNHISKILWFWIEHIKTAQNFWKMHQICW